MEQTLASIPLPDAGPPIAGRGNFIRSIGRSLRAPILAELLRHRAICAFLAGVAIAQISTAAAHLTLVYCPMPHLLGIPCPGCGLTRSTVYLLAGRWKEGLTQHAGSPLILLGVAVLILAVLLPAGARDRLSAAVGFMERRTAFVPLMLSMLMIYWLVRLFLSPEDALRDLH